MRAHFAEGLGATQFYAAPHGGGMAAAFCHATIFDTLQRRSLLGKPDIIDARGDMRAGRLIVDDEPLLDAYRYAIYAISRQRCGVVTRHDALST